MEQLPHLKHPVKIPADQGKLIEEFIGKISTKDEHVSLAHMVAPPQWTEPAQTPEFEEITIMIRGKMQIDYNGNEFELNAGEVFFAKPNKKVRYSNPFNETAEYWAVCLPAFDIEKVNREL